MKNTNILNLSEGNKKLVSLEGKKFLIWNIQAVETCPYATKMCIKMCYAKKAENQYPSAKASRYTNYSQSLNENFVSKMIETIEHHMSRKKYQGSKIFFRIHESGDFYSVEYMQKWFDIARHFEGNQNITFLAYTKSLPFFDSLIKSGITKPSNLVIRASKWDDTALEQLELIEKYNLPYYTAMPKAELENAGKDIFKCSCDCVSCATCQACYNGKVLRIACAIH